MLSMYEVTVLRLASRRAMLTGPNIAGTVKAPIILANAFLCCLINIHYFIQYRVSLIPMVLSHKAACVNMTPHSYHQYFIVCEFLLEPLFIMIKLDAHVSVDEQNGLNFEAELIW